MKRMFIFLSVLFGLPVVAAAVPTVSSHDAVFTDSEIDFVFHFASPNSSYADSSPQGWIMQLFMDTDSNPTTGVYDRFEFVASPYRYLHPNNPLDDSREWLNDSLSVRDIVSAGWHSPSLGLVTLEFLPQSVAFRIPLLLLGGDDGRMSYYLELYDNSTGNPFVRAYGGTSHAVPEPSTIYLILGGTLLIATMTRLEKRMPVGIECPVAPQSAWRVSAIPTVTEAHRCRRRLFGAR